MTTKLRAAFALTTPLLIGFLIQACGDDDAPAETPIDAGADNATTPPIDSSSDTSVVPSSTTLWKSGTRLRAEVLELAGSADAKRFDVFFDTVRNETCTMRGVANAETRCIPTNIREVAYDDAECKTPIAGKVGAEICPGVSYFVRPGPSTDPCAMSNLTIMQVWLQGAEIPARDVFHRNPNGTCVLHPASSLKYRALGAEVALTEFVRATVVKEEVSAAISRDRLRGDDGSELVSGDLYDRARGDARCGWQPLGPWNARVEVCGPLAPGHTSNIYGPFLDSTCTPGATAGVTFDQANCPPKTLVRSDPVDAGASQCGAGTYDNILLAVGAPITTPVFQPGPTGSGCVARVPEPNYPENYYAVGAPIDPATFPPTPQAFFGTGRARIQTPASAGIPLMIQGSFFDNDASCFPFKFADGKEYCASFGGSLQYTPRTTTTNFKDANCTQPIFLTNECASTLGNPTFLITNPPDTGPTPSSCTTKIEYDAMGWGLGAKQAITQHWQKTGPTATCDGPYQLQSVPVDVAYDLLPQEPVANKLLEVKRVRE